MSTAVSRRRGTATEHESFTGNEGEISVNTTNQSLHVHNGSTAGGFELARKDLSNVPTIDSIPIGGTTPAAGSFTQVTVDNLFFNGAAITSDTGAISFDNENLSTTGSVTANSLVFGTQAGKATLSYTTDQARTLTVPSLGGNRTFSFIDQSETITGTKTFSAQLTASDNLIANGFIGRGGFTLNSRTWRDSVTTTQAIAAWASNVGGTQTNVALVRVNGDFESATNSYGALSDRTLKKDIEPAKSQWDDVKAIASMTCNFTMKNSDLKQIGWVAQDVQKVSPGLVSKVDMGEGKESIEVLKMATSVLYAKAVKALGENMERTEALEAKVAALEAQLNPQK